MAVTHKTDVNLKKRILDYMEMVNREVTTDELRSVLCADSREISGVLRRLHGSGIIYRVDRDRNKSKWRKH